MASLMKIGKLSRQLLMKNVPLISIVRSYEEIKMPVSFREYVRQDLNPEIRETLIDLYPDTEEKRLAAAKKYDLHPDEYKPFPDDDGGYGEYPDLPLISYDAKDPFYPWDYEDRHNFGEVMPVDSDLLAGDRTDYGVRKPMKDSTASRIFIFGFLTLVVLGCLSPMVTIPEMQIQYPGKGVHYTFEVQK